MSPSSLLPPRPPPCFSLTPGAGGAVGALLRPLSMGYDALHLPPQPVLGARYHRQGARDHPMLRARLQGVRPAASL